MFIKFDSRLGFVYPFLIWYKTDIVSQTAIVSLSKHIVDASSYLFGFLLECHWLLDLITSYACRNRHWWWTRWGWSFAEYIR